MNNAKLSAPWVCYYHELEAFFEEDPDVIVTYDNDNVEVHLYVEGQAKADALDALLPNELEFGNVILKIIVIPANKERTKASLIKDALTGNKNFAYSESVDLGPMANTMNFFVFKNKVAQYFTDDASDIHGLRSTLYQDMAEEIFGESEGVYFCTDIPYEE